MKKIEDNVIFKIISCLIVLIVMGAIVFFVYQYYDDLAKNGNNSNNKNNGEKIIETTNEEEKNVFFEVYNLKEDDIVIDGTIYTLNVELTDAGSVLTINDNPITDIYLNTYIKYAVLDDIIIFDIVNDGLSSILFVDLDYHVFARYSSNYNYGHEFVIAKPFIEEKYNDYVVIKNNNIYITFVLKELISGINVDDNDIIQYTMVLEYSDGSLVDDSNISSKYMYKEYKNKS